MSHWQLKLNSCKQSQGKSILSFMNRVENLYVKVINSLDTTLTKEARQVVLDAIKHQALHVFVTGLIKDISLVVKSQKPSSLENAIALALAEEKESKSKQEILRYPKGNRAE